MLEQERDKEIRSYVRERFEYEPGLSLAETLKAYNVIRRQLNESTRSVAETNRDILLDILSDARAAAPMVQTANFHSSANPKSYFYVFAHKSIYGDYSWAKIGRSIHGEELPYVFGVPLDNVNFPSHRRFSVDERRFSEAVMTFWTNFAKTGNPNAPHRQAHFAVDWPEYDSFNQTYLHLAIPSQIGHHYRKKAMDFWNKRLPDILKDLPPNESANPAERPQILPPEETHPQGPHYYNPKRTQGNTWYRFPPHHATQTPTVYGTIVNRGSEKSKAASTVLLGVDREFGSRLPEEKAAGAAEPPPEVDTGSSSSLAMSIVIVIGVCLLLVNLCAFAGLYYKRDRLRAQERLMKKRYEDVEPTNNRELYMNQTKDEENDEENITALQITGREDIKKNKKNQSSGEETYEAVRSRVKTVDGREGGVEEEDVGENSSKRWRLSRQCSASTMDPHTKVREWIAHEIVQRCSPRFLRRAKFQLQTQANRPVLQKDSSFDTSIDQLSSAVMTTAENCEPNPSSPALSKPTTTTTLQRARVKKVSVAVDATPAARSASVLKQIPIEQLSKSLEELGGEKNISTTAEGNKAELKRSQTCRESLARSSSSPVPSLSPQRDTVLRRSTTSVNFQVCQPILKKQNKSLNIVHQHSKSDPVPRTTHIVPQDTPQQSYSQSVIPQVYNISIDSKGGPSSPTYTEVLPTKQMKSFPTSGTHVKFKQNAPKRDIGITASAASNRMKDINVTSRDSALTCEEMLPVTDPLKNIQKRNFPKVLPDLPPGQDVLIAHEIQLHGGNRELTPVQAVAAKRRSLPPPTHLLVGILAPNKDAGSASQPSTPTGAHQKDNQTQTQAGKIPPPPPPRVSSTLGRKPNNTAPVEPFETTHGSAKLKNTVLPSSSNYHQRPEPKVIIKPTSTSPITRNLPSTQQGRAKQQIPRVTPNTGDYPLTTTTLHQTGVSPAQSLSRESSLRSQHAAQLQDELSLPTQNQQVHRAAVPTSRSDASTATPPQKTPGKKSTDTTSDLPPTEDASSNTGTVRRVKKTNQTNAGNPQLPTPSMSKGSSVPKAWYAQYNQSFLSKTKDSEN
ncbi:hypothetical protein B7P43_G11411 [Cryptotermes secundus]|nr:hypothetical protein B7P43_G11411 [Cryptotermes secundus]